MHSSANSTHRIKMFFDFRQRKKNLSKGKKNGELFKSSIGNTVTFLSHIEIHLEYCFQF